MLTIYQAYRSCKYEAPSNTAFFQTEESAINYVYESAKERGDTIIKLGSYEDYVHYWEEEFGCYWAISKIEVSK